MSCSERTRINEFQVSSSEATLKELGMGETVCFRLKGQMFG